MEKLLEAFDDDVAAVIYEPVQGEGGIDFPDNAYIKKVRSLVILNCLK
jgi:acetylornithine/succinyldiaminopimelate/putrescine aminotransferase